MATVIDSLVCDTSDLGGIRIPLSAEQYARMEMVRLAVQQGIPFEHIPKFARATAKLIVEQTPNGDA